MRKPLTTFGAVMAALTLPMLTITGCSTMNQQWHRNCTIEAKDTLYGSNSEGGTTREYRLTTSCGTFTVGDTLAGGFSSWDTWASLEEGERYDLETGGYRIGLFSQFPSVISVEAR
ncbi:membrane protein [Gordonia phage Morgana]|uniref:Membrane protein n=1 Tax=Gordonia phage Morgana TaxID=3137292 RepID=A0AAX4RBT1_9CAUD